MSASKSSPPNIVYSLAKADELEEIVAHVYRYFFKKEPLSASINLINDRLERIEAIDVWLKMALSENLSIVAKDKLANDKIVGVRISSVSTPENMDAWAPQPGQEKFMELMALCTGIYRNVDVFAASESSKIFDLVLGSVDENYQRQNIFTEMTARSLMLARVLGFRAAKVIASSAYTTRVFNKFKFDSLFKTAHAEHLGLNGEYVFASTGPVHTHSTLMIKKLAPFVAINWNKDL